VALEATASWCDVEGLLYGEVEGEVACSSVAPPWALASSVLARLDADMDGAVGANETCLTAAALEAVAALVDDDGRGREHATLGDVEALVLGRELAVVEALEGALWEEADSDGSGALSADELAALMRVLRVLLPHSAAAAPNGTEVAMRLQRANQTWCDVGVSAHWAGVLAGANRSTGANCSAISAASIDALPARISNLVESLQEWAQCTPAGAATGSMPDQTSMPNVTNGMNVTNGTNTTRRLLAVRDEGLVRHFLRPGDAFVYCAAALIHPEWVMTTARCVAGEEIAVVGADKVVLLGGDESACGGGKVGVAEVVVHPGYSALTGAHDVALLRLRAPASVPPVELYTGGDLAFTDCTPVTLETAAYTPGGSVWQAALDVIGHEACDALEHTRRGVRGTVTEGMACAVPPGEGEWALPGRLALGSPVVSRVLGKPPRLVGVVTDPGAGESEEARLALAAWATQWVWSIKGLGVSPPRALHLSFTALALQPNVSLAVRKGPDSRAGDEASLLHPPPAASYSDAGDGSLRLVLSSTEHPSRLALQRLDAALEVKTCEEEVGARGSCRGVEGCGRRGCPDSECVLRAAGWDEILRMHPNGTAMSGGMGELVAEFKHRHETSWVCLRDWDQAEQLKCAAGPGQLACFFWDAKAKRFNFYGLNSEVALVDAAEEEEAVEKQKASWRELSALT